MAAAARRSTLVPCRFGPLPSRSVIMPLTYLLSSEKERRSPMSKNEPSLWVLLQHSGWIIRVSPGCQKKGTSVRRQAAASRQCQSRPQSHFLKSTTRMKISNCDDLFRSSERSTKVESESQLELRRQCCGEKGNEIAINSPRIIFQRVKSGVDHAVAPKSASEDRILRRSFVRYCLSESDTSPHRT